MITWFLTTKLGRWLAGIAAVLAAILGVWLAGHRSGKQAQKHKDDEASSEANHKAAEAVQKVSEDRAHVDSEVEKLPDAGIQEVATADPATAAGRLRDDGWVRPEGNGQD